MHTGSHFDDGVKDVWKRLLWLNRLTVQFKLAGRRRRNDIGLTVRKRGAIHRPHDLPGVFVCCQDPGGERRENENNN